MPVTLLVIEDDRDVQRLFQALLARDPGLARNPVRLIQAFDGEEGIRLFKDEEPDVVVTDLLLPKMDGIAVCKAIRETEHGRDIPLLATSGVYREPGVVEELRREHGVGFFAKPQQVRELCRTVVDLCTGRHAAPAASAGHEWPARPRLATPTPVEVSRRGVTAGPARAVAARSGDLACTSPARLLLDLHDQRATGRVALASGRMKRAVWLVDGTVVFADSNLRRERLGELLVEWGVLTGRRLVEAGEVAAMRKTPLAQALVALGWRTEAEAAAHLAAQVELKVRNALAWGEGRYEFRPGDRYQGDLPRLSIDLPGLVLSTLAALPAPAGAAGTVRATPRLRRYRTVVEALFGRRLVERLERGPLDAGAAAEEVGEPVEPSKLWALRETGLVEEAAPSRGPAREDADRGQERVDERADADIRPVESPARREP